ncbi:hypothetical protein O3P69_004803 [Scylla paramamosain]|uniref:Uncharacterized protein n=1 Tax=Scylla paramamosain TaxID=85552 RepID=A0AAW0UDC7_SCYPA
MSRRVSNASPLVTCASGQVRDAGGNALINVPAKIQVAASPRHFQALPGIPTSGFPLVAPSQPHATPTTHTTAPPQPDTAHHSPDTAHSSQTQPTTAHHSPPQPDTAHHSPYKNHVM